MFVNLNAQYDHSGIKTFTVDSVYSPYDHIPMSRKTSSNDVKMDDQSRSSKPKTSLTDSAIRKNSNNSNNSTDFMSSIHSTSGDRQKEDGKVNFTQIMQERWQRSNMNLP